MSVASGQEGGCQCGAIRYQLLRAPAALYACHCRDCQKQSSSAFGLSMWVERDAIEFTGTRAAHLSYPRRLGPHQALRVLRRVRHAALPRGRRDARRRKHDPQHESRHPRRHLGHRAQPSRPPAICGRSARNPWMAPVLERDLCFADEPDSEETLRAQWREAGGA